MEFPKYVPDQVRGYCEALPWSELSPDVQDCIRRLVERPEMEGVYKLVPDGNQACELIDAAWSARLNYQRYRDDLERAKEIGQRIAEKASELAELLRRFPRGVDAPREFASLCRLLEITDNPSDPMWTIERPRVTAQQTGNGGAVVVWLPAREGELVPEHQEGPVRLYDTANPPPMREASPDPVRQQRRAWGRAPKLPELLDALVHVARWNEPSAPSEMIEAALSSRKHNEKWRYLRALAHVLAECEMELPTQAIATTASVVLGDDDVTDGEVRKAIDHVRKQ